MVLEVKGICIYTVDGRIRIALAEGHEASFSVICITWSARGIQRFLQHFNACALGEIAGAHNVSAQHNRAACVVLRRGAELCEGEGRVNVLTHLRREHMGTSGAQQCHTSPQACEEP